MVFYFKSIENRIKRCRLDKAVLQPFLTGIAANGSPLVLKQNRERFFFRGNQNASFIYVEIHDIF